MLLVSSMKIESLSWEIVFVSKAWACLAFPRQEFSRLPQRVVGGLAIAYAELDRTHQFCLGF